MTVTAGFLEGVSTGLSSLAAALGASESSAAGTFGAVGGHLADVAASWGGPRSEATVGQARAYVDAVAEFPGAVGSARGTVERWAATAAEYAAHLSVLEATWRRLLSDPIGVLFGDAERGLLATTISQIELTDVLWQRACNTFAAELTGAIAAVNRANNATAYPPPDSWVLSTMPTTGGPQAIASWWASLSPTSQMTLAASMPAYLGGLDGMPAEIRDLVNRILLVADLARLQALVAAGTISAVQSRVLENVRAVIRIIESHESHIDYYTHQPTIAQLYIYEPAAFDADGRIAIAVGDLDTADHVAITVPGMWSDATGLGAGRVQNIYDEARWATNGSDSVAVLDWMGYDAPNFNVTAAGGVPERFGDAVDEALDLAGVVNMGMATAGAELLAADVAGLNAMGGNNDPHLTVIGNSYGSTTTAIAADEFGLGADDVVLTGSPGAGNADHAGDLITGTEHTWVGSASHDLVTYFGETGGWDPADAIADALPGVEQMGNDPSEDAFGANRFQAEHVDRGDRWNIDDHGRYYSTDSESLYNVSAVVTGEYDLVVDADPRHKNPFVETQNPIEDVDVDAGASVDVPTCDIPGPINVPCGIPDVDAHLDVDVDVQAPVEVNAWPVDPEGSRTPDPDGMTHEPDD